MAKPKLVVPIVIVSLAMLACSISQVPKTASINTADVQITNTFAADTEQPTATVTHQPFPTRTSTPYEEVRPIDELYATDPMDFSLASGQIQFIELFAFW